MCSQRTFSFRNEKRQAGELNNSRSRGHSLRARAAKVGHVQGHFTVHVGDAFSGRVSRCLPVGADLQTLPELQGWAQLSLPVHPSPNPQHLAQSCWEEPEANTWLPSLLYPPCLWVDFLRVEQWAMTLGLGLGWSKQALVLVLSKRQKEMPQAQPFPLKCYSGRK